MNDLEMQAVIGNLSRANLKPKLKEGLERLVRELQAINDKYTRELMGIDHDKRYTPEGKKLLKQELGAGIIDDLAKYANPYGEHIKQAEGKLLNGDHQVKRTDTEVLMDYMQNAELRRMYGVEKMDALQIEANIDDPLFVSAVLTSPKPLLPQAQLDRLIQQKAKEASPELSVDLEQLTFADKTVRGIVKTLEATVKSQGYQDPNNPLTTKLKAVADPVKEAAAA